MNNTRLEAKKQGVVISEGVTTIFIPHTNIATTHARNDVAAFMRSLP